MKNTLKIISYSSNPGGKKFIHLYYSNKGKKLYINTGVDADKKDAKNDDQVVLFYSTFSEILSKFLKDNLEYPSTFYMKEQMDNAKGGNFEKSNKNDVENIFEKFLERKKGFADWTYKAWNVTFRKDLFDFLKEYKVSLDNVDESFLRKWDTFIKNRKFRGEYLKDNGIIHKHKMMKSFLTTCYDLKYIKHYDISDTLWKDIKSTKNGLIRYRQNFVSISADELAFLKSKRGTLPYHKKNKYNKILDMFIFQCLTSLRYSDMIKINKNSIDDNMISTIAQKTKKEILVDIAPTVRSILVDNDYNLYWNIDTYDSEIKKILDNFSEEMPIFKEEHRIVEYRGGGKECVKYKKLSDLIGSHTGRRTFVSINNDDGISLEKVIKATGHSSITGTVRKYITDSNKKKLQVSTDLDNRTNFIAEDVDDNINLSDIIPQTDNEKILLEYLKKMEEKMNGIAN